MGVVWTALIYGSQIKNSLNQGCKLIPPFIGGNPCKRVYTHPIFMVKIRTKHISQAPPCVPNPFCNLWILTPSLVSRHEITMLLNQVILPPKFLEGSKIRPIQKTKKGKNSSQSKKMTSKNQFNSKNNKNKKETKAPQTSSPKKKQRLPKTTQRARSNTGPSLHWPFAQQSSRSHHGWALGVGDKLKPTLPT